TVREHFAADLVGRGVVRQGDPEAFLKSGLDEFQRIRESVRRDNTAADSALPQAGEVRPPESGSPDWDLLKALNEKLLTFPNDFHVHPKLERALQRRRVAFERPDAPVDWAHAETLAFATLLHAGVPIRLTGQDVLRGTFSQ